MAKKSVIDLQRCKKCGACLQACPYGAISETVVPCEHVCPIDAISKDERGHPVIDFSKCIRCGKCMAACPFEANYKESTTEPSVLPAALPNLLMNGSTGIAVGMTTNIPPHNLGELIDATCKIIDNPDVSIGELCATGGVVVGTKSIKRYLSAGRGIIKNRGVVTIEEGQMAQYR
jgi:Fe-S-cluster-containing hydrogenase component 2